MSVHIQMIESDGLERFLLLTKRSCASSGLVSQYSFSPRNGLMGARTTPAPSAAHWQPSPSEDGPLRNLPGRTLPTCASVSSVQKSRGLVNLPCSTVGVTCGAT